MYEKLKEIYILVLSGILLFILILTVFSKGSEQNITIHNANDSYTLQAMAWRDGRVALDKNYPWLELAVLNNDYFENNSMNDYKSYKEYFYDENNQFIEYKDNEYYVSFPPFPSVPMYLLTFIFGENTPSNIISILYGIGAFVFAILIGRRFKYSYLHSICGAILITIASSTFFLLAAEFPGSGSVWYMAQLLSLFLTTAAFYFIHGKNEKDIYAAFILLGFAVGCRPFQILYYFYFAYVILKKYNYKFVKTIKFYIPAAIIGICYMVYNYVRFGSIFEFGHNYLPEMMLAPDGQFNLSYITVNYKRMFFLLPEISGGSVEFSDIGFACWITNVIFIITFVTLIFSIKNYLSKASNVDNSSKKKTANINAIILFILIVIHFVLILMHKSLGMLQFGSRYTIDTFPATLVLLTKIMKPIIKKKKSATKCILYYVCIVCILGGTILNVSATLNYFNDLNIIYSTRDFAIFIICILTSLVLFITFLIKYKFSRTGKEKYIS